LELNNKNTIFAKKRKEEFMDSFKRCTCTKKDAAEIFAAAEIIYKKKFNKLPSKSTYTKKEYAEIILDAATMMYQKKYNKYSKSDVYKLKEEIDDNFEDFYDDLLDQIYNVNDDKTLTDKNFENEVLEWMDYYENTLRFT